MEFQILLVEDDEALSFIIKDHLTKNKYAVEHYKEGKKALEAFKSKTFHCCILDIMLPEMDGFELAKQIRSIDEDVPIIFLTARSLTEDRIYGLRIGADDYITKPFSIEELLLKIKIFLRRSNVVNPSIKTQIYRTGQYIFNYPNLQLIFNGKAQKLTQREGDLLKMLVEHKGSIVKREDILNKLWGSANYYTSRSLDVFISRLRKLLQNDPKIKIENIHNVGYRLTDR